MRTILRPQRCLRTISTGGQWFRNVVLWGCACCNEINAPRVRSRLCRFSPKWRRWTRKTRQLSRSGHRNQWSKDNISSLLEILVNMAGAVNIERLLSADTESYRTVRLKHVRRFGSVRGWADAEMDEFKGVHISERQTHFKIYNKLESLKPG